MPIDNSNRNWAYLSFLGSKIYPYHLMHYYHYSDTRNRISHHLLQPWPSPTWWRKVHARAPIYPNFLVLMFVCNFFLKKIQGKTKFKNNLVPNLETPHFWALFCFILKSWHQFFFPSIQDLLHNSFFQSKSYKINKSAVCNDNHLQFKTCWLKIYYFLPLFLGVVLYGLNWYYFLFFFVFCFVWPRFSKANKLRVIKFCLVSKIFLLGVCGVFVATSNVKLHGIIWYGSRFW